MERHLDVELSDLKKKLLLMGGSVESQLQDVLQALTERDSDLAIRVVENDLVINALDLEIDETCLDLLALHHPKAGDLRFITTTMKISAELEQMGDLAENIAERAIELNEESVAFRPGNSSNQGHYLSNLGNTIQQRYEWTGSYVIY